MSWPALRLPKPDLERSEGVRWEAWATPEDAAYVQHRSKIDRRPRVLTISYSHLSRAQADWLELEWHASGRGAEPRSLALPDGSGSIDVLFEDLTLSIEDQAHSRSRATLRFVEAL